MEAQKPTPVRSISSYACEACRSAKTRCQPGPQPGICKRCSEFKRECVFRTGPRTRRSKAATAAAESASLPPPPRPSKTFSINFTLPATEDPTADFESLRIDHERFIDDLVPAGDVGEEGTDDDEIIVDEPSSATHKEKKPFDFNDMSSSASPSVTSPDSGHVFRRSGKSATSGRRERAKGPSAVKPMHDMGIKPQFNLESASRLLRSFGRMLPHMPCLVLDDLVPPSTFETTENSNNDDAGGSACVRALARSRPFVLLAILAVTSCSSSLQGYSLYDEEFRKVLGLKFVAGGERSIELLQGLLIYCSWYPFHLRPKNRQLFQYLRMAVDIVQDLELEETDLDGLATLEPEEKARSMEGLRGLLSCFYAVSTFCSIWSKRSGLQYTPQLALCVDAFEQHSTLDQDQNLVWLVRLQYIFEELKQLGENFYARYPPSMNAMHHDLLHVGLETQLRDYESRMPEKCASFPSIRQLLLQTQLFILIPEIRQLWSSNTKRLSSETRPKIRNEEMQQAVHRVRLFFDGVLTLPREELDAFSGTDYSRLIVATILGVRLSFPLTAISPDYDVAAGRQTIDFGKTLERFAAMDRGGGTGEKEDEIAGDDGGEASQSPTSTTSATQRASGKEKGSASTSAANANTGANENPGILRKPPPKPKRTDTFTAFLVVLRSVKAKFDAKSKNFEENIAPRDFRAGCPVMDGSLDKYIPLWAGSQQPLPGSHPPLQQHSYNPYYHDANNSINPQAATVGGFANMPNGDVMEMGSGMMNDMGMTDSTANSSLYATSQGSGSVVDGFVRAPVGLTDGNVAPGSGSGLMGAEMGMGMGMGMEGGSGDKSAMFHDLWSTMTMGWAGDNDETSRHINLQDLDNLNYDDFDMGF